MKKFLTIVLVAFFALAAIGSMGSQEKEASLKDAYSSKTSETEMSLAEETSLPTVKFRSAEEYPSEEPSGLDTEEVSRVAASIQVAEEESRVAASRQVAEEESRVAASRQAAEEESRAAASRQDAEEESRAAASRQAAEEESRAAASKQAAEEASRAAASRQAAEEASRVAASKQAAEEASRAAAAEAARRNITVTSGLVFRRNQNATVSIKAMPNTLYTIVVLYKSGPSKAQGLDPKWSNSQGIVSWTWKIGGKTTPGTYSIIIEGGGAKIEKSFTIVTN